MTAHPNHSAFIREHGYVVMVSEHGPIRLDDSQCERLLDIWGEAEGPAAARLFNSLYDVHMANGGVPRCVPRASHVYGECALASASAEPSAAGAA